MRLVLRCGTVFRYSRPRSEGCGTGTLWVDASEGGVSSEASAAALPDSAYYVDPALEKWVDPETGYDTTREWKLDGGAWPIAIVMSPSQVLRRSSPTVTACSIRRSSPSASRLRSRRSLPPRTFHALQRSRWPFVYMPMAVFTDYVRSNDNQGGAGGLQYVALAGSTAGGGYTLLTKDPTIKTVADLAGKKVAQANSNPVPGTLLSAAAKKAGLSVGDGKGQINSFGAPQATSSTSTRRASTTLSSPSTSPRRRCSLAARAPSLTSRTCATRPTTRSRGGTVCA